MSMRHWSISLPFHGSSSKSRGGSNVETISRRWSPSVRSIVEVNDLVVIAVIGGSRSLVETFAVIRRCTACIYGQCRTRISILTKPTSPRGARHALYRFHPRLNGHTRLQFCKEYQSVTTVTSTVDSLTLNCTLLPLALLQLF
jgi:hypothetical protein